MEGNGGVAPGTPSPPGSPDANNNQDFMLVQFYRNIDLIASSSHPDVDTIAIANATQQIDNYMTSTLSDEVVKNLSAALDDSKYDARFKQLCGILLHNYFGAAEDWNTLSEIAKAKLKAELLAGYWAQTDTAILNIQADFISKIYTDYGGKIYVEDSTTVLENDAKQLVQSVDANLNPSEKPETQQKSLILLRAFVEMLSCVDVATCQHFANKVLPFLDDHKPVSRLTYLALDVLSMLFSSLYCLNTELDKLHTTYKSVALWLKNHLNQGSFDVARAGLRTLFAGVERICVNGSQSTNQELPGSQFLQELQNDKLPKDIRAGLIYLLTKSLEISLVVPSNTQQLIKAAFFALKEGVAAEGLSSVAFELEALESNGLLLSSCRFIERLSIYPDSKIWMRWINQGLKADKNSKLTTCIMIGLIAESQHEAIAKHQSELITAILKICNSDCPKQKLVGAFALVQICRFLRHGISATDVTFHVLEHLISILESIESGGEAKRNNYPVVMSHCQEALKKLIGDEVNHGHLVKFSQQLCARIEQCQSLTVSAYVLELLNTLESHSIKRIYDGELGDITNLVFNAIDKCINTSAENHVTMKPDHEQLLSNSLNLLETLVTRYFMEYSQDQIQQLVSKCIFLCGMSALPTDVGVDVYKLITGLAKSNLELLPPESLISVVDRMLNSLKQDIVFDIQEGESMELDDDDTVDIIGLSDGASGNVQLVTDKINILIRLTELHRVTWRQFELVLMRVIKVLETIGTLSSPRLKSAAIRTHLNIVMHTFVTAETTDKKESVLKTMAEYINGNVAMQLSPEMLKEDNLETIIANLNFIRYGLFHGGKEVIRVSDDVRETIMEILKAALMEHRFYSNFPAASSLIDDLQNDQDFVATCSLFDVLTKTMVYFGYAIDATHFVPFFSDVMAIISSKYDDGHVHLIGKLLIVGLVADLIKVAGENIKPYVDTLTTWFTEQLEDPCPGLQRTAIYGLGELALVCPLNTAQIIYENLQKVKTMDPNVNDNLGAAFAKIAVAHPNFQEVNNFVRFIQEHLPLKNDFLEYEAVFSCYIVLMESDKTRNVFTPACVKSLMLAMNHVIEIKDILYDIQDTDEADRILETGIQLMNLLHKDFNKVFQNALMWDMPSKASAERLLSACNIS